MILIRSRPCWKASLHSEAMSHFINSKRWRARTSRRRIADADAGLGRETGECVRAGSCGVREGRSGLSQQGRHLRSVSQSDGSPRRVDVGFESPVTALEAPASSQTSEEAKRLKT